MGAAGGWLYYAGTIILTVGLGVLLGGFIKDNLLTAFEIDLDLPIWVWDAVVAALLLRGPLPRACRSRRRVQLALALISIAVVLVFFVTVISKLGDANDFAKALDPSPDGGFSGILFGVLYGVLIFVGFETAANLAEETAEPKRSIPRAVLGAVVLVSIFYVIAAYVEVAGFGFDLAVITSAEVAGAPLFALGAPGGEFGSEFWLKVLILVVFLDMLAVYVGAGVASTRGMFAMARDRRLPAPLASVSSRFGTPAGAIALLIVDPGAPDRGERMDRGLRPAQGLPHYFALFAWCSTFGGFALLVVYLMMSIGALASLGRQAKPVGVAIAAILGIAHHGGGDLGLLLQGADTDDLGASVRPDLVRDRSRLHVRREGPGAGEPGARRPAEHEGVRA